MKLSTQSGQVEFVVVFVAKIVTTTLPSKGSYRSPSISASSVSRRGVGATSGRGSQFYLWECLPNDPTQQFRWHGRTHGGGRAIQWHEQDREFCLDAETFSNGDAVIAYGCTTQLLDHQMWAVL